MSLIEFLGRFGTASQCAEAVRQARWPGGFRCPRCGAAEHDVVGHGQRKLFQCNACRHQGSPTAGNLISQAKTGLSALAMKRQLGVSYPTAWLLHHKINRVMTAQDRQERIGGTVQVDDAYLGGDRAGSAGQAGRGSPNKVPFVAAVSVNALGRPVHLKLEPLSGFAAKAIAQWATASLHPGTVMLSDGLACFAAVKEAGCVHHPRVVGALKPRDLPEFRWVNTVPGNLNTTLAGAYHALKYCKYAQFYLAAFTYRFNRRFDLRALISSLIVDVARCQPIRECVVRSHAEARF